MLFQVFAFLMALAVTSQDVEGNQDNKTTLEKITATIEFCLSSGCDGPSSHLETIPCYCDQHCHTFGDCCLDNPSQSPPSDEALPNDQQFECTRTFLNLPRCSFDNHNSYQRMYHKMVTQCETNWEATQQVEKLMVSELCKNSPLSTEPPVTDIKTGVAYRNKYCGVCNNITIDQLMQWPSLWSCDAILEDFLQASVPISMSLINVLCELDLFKPPEADQVPFTPTDSLLPGRPCWPLISTCPSEQPGNLSETLDFDSLVGNCTMMGIGKIVSTNGVDIYSNPYCGLCNSVPAQDLRCYLTINPCIYIAGSRGPHKTFTLSSYPMYSILYNGSEARIALSTSCDNGTVHNPYTGACHKQIYFNEIEKSSCTLISLNTTNHLALDSITVRWFSDNGVYTVNGFDSENHPYICANLSQDTKTSGKSNEPRRRYTLAVNILSYCGLVLDFLSGIFILFTYCIYKDLQTLYGKLLMNMVTLVLLSDVMIIVAYPISEAMNNMTFCIIVAISTHYVFLVRFLSCSVLMFEAIRHFYYSLRLIPPSDKHSGKTNKLLSIYLAVLYIPPAILVMFSVFINFTVEGAIGYGLGTFDCWMTNILAITLSFTVPVFISFLFNIGGLVFCIYVVVKLSCVSRTGQPKTRSDVLLQNFRVVVAIVAVSGITWALFLVVILTGITNTRSSKLWENYIYIVINSSQLVLVAVTYVCSKNMMRRYYKTFQQCKCSRQQPPKMTEKISSPASDKDHTSSV